MKNLILGKVIKKNSNKTLKVLFFNYLKNFKYKKYNKYKKIFIVHDEYNLCCLGDYIYFVKNKPISKIKFYKLYLIKNDYYRN